MRSQTFAHTFPRSSTLHFPDVWLPDNSSGADHFYGTLGSEWRCVSVEMITRVTSFHFLYNLSLREDVSMQREWSDLDKALAWVIKEKHSRGKFKVQGNEGTVKKPKNAD